MPATTPDGTPTPAMDLLGPAIIVSARRPVDPAAVVAELRDPGRWSIRHTDRTGSSNSDLAAEPRVPHGRVLIAEEQTAGRGRSGRGWVCPPRAGLMFSVALRSPVPPDRRGWTGAVLGLSIVSALGQLGMAARLKWPNDVLIDGAKCAGILAESLGAAAAASPDDETPDAASPDDGTLPAGVVVGAGINVTVTQAELPRADTTSLLLAATRSGLLDGTPYQGVLDRTVLLAGILDELGDRIDRWVGAGGDIDASGLRLEYQQVCATLGMTVRLHLPSGGEVVADAEDVGVDGSLVVRDAAGRRHRYAAADVVHVRPGH